MIRILFISCSFFLVAVACSQSVQDGAGKMFDNAGSVIQSGGDKLVTSPTPSSGEGKVEGSARQVFENAGSVVQSGTSKIVTSPSPAAK